MVTRYRLEPLSSSEEADRWDELITVYESRGLFHRKVWLDYLAACRNLDISLWAIQDGCEIVGYFCGGMLRKGFFRILGSPLKGWVTNFMGPVVNHGFDLAAFLESLDVLAKAEGLAMIEIENPILSDADMIACGYEAVIRPNYSVKLTPEDPEQMWNAIDLKSRQKIRKAQRLGLLVEDTSDARMPDEFFDQFVEVLARKNLFPPYSRSCPRLLFEYLKPRDMLFALRIRDPEGDVVASGLFPHDEQTMYFWGGASRISAWNYSPNDLLQWSAMKIGAERGLRVYNMCGYGYFKSKFGGVLEETRRWHKCYWRTAKWARRGYEVYCENRIRAQGLCQRVFRSV